MAEPVNLLDFFVPMKPRTRYIFDAPLPGDKYVPSEPDWVTYDDSDIVENGDADDYEPIEWSNERKKERAVSSEDDQEPSERSNRMSVVISADSHEPSERSKRMRRKSVKISSDDQEPSERMSKKKKKKSDNERPKKGLAPRLGKKEKVEGPEPPPELPERVRDVIAQRFGGSGETLILQKRLHTSDLQKQQNRLSMPMRRLLSTDFLTEDEQKQLSQRGERNRIVGINVQVIGPRLASTKLVFKRWDLNSTSNYIFTTDWCELALANDLCVDQIIQVWFFRDRLQNPCFAVVKLDSTIATSHPPNHESTIDGSGPPKT